MSSDPNGIGRLSQDQDFPTLTVCGSMRYFPLMLIASAQYTAEGWIVLMPFSVEEEGSATKTMLDQMHLAKIKRSKAILVVGNHIGESTTREIEYANSLGLAVIPYEHNARKSHVSVALDVNSRYPRAGRFCVCGCPKHADQDQCNHCYFGSPSPDGDHGAYTVPGAKPSATVKQLPVNTHCTNCRQPIGEGGWTRENTREKYRIHFKCPVVLTAHGRERDSSDG